MDFVLSWVDDSDPNWQSLYRSNKDIYLGDTHEARFRDWGLLRYWFRSIEQFAPWVNRIHFITWGHLPHWLKTNHPKINIVRHEEYIPAEYLPTFNSRTILLNVHRIKSLADHYVYFDDDTFLLRPIKPQFFFKNGLPCDQAAMKILRGNKFTHTLLEGTAFIDNHLPNKWLTVSQSPLKWFNPCYRKYLFTNLILLATTRHFTGFETFHLPQPARKNTLIHLWKVDRPTMHASCANKFRDLSTVNTYVQRYWELATNNFYPVNMNRRGRCFELRRDSVEVARQFIAQRKLPMVCINDHEAVINFKYAKMIIDSAFEKILPNRSTFENE